MKLFSSFIRFGRPAVVAGVLALSASFAWAVTIQPVAVTASSTFFTYNANNLINGSGLTGPLHDTAFENMWMNNGTGANGVLVFDLGQVYNLTAASVWQYNATCCGLNRGVRDFSISLSNNGIGYVPATTASLSISPGGSIAANLVPFSGSGRYVRFEILSNFGDPTYTGLSEVRFEGALVPEPATGLLLALGVGWFAVMGRRGLKAKAHGRA